MKRMMKKPAQLLCAAVLTCSMLLSACGSQNNQTDQANQTDQTKQNNQAEEPELKLDATQKEATELTKERNQAVYELLDFQDEREVEFAKKGLLAAPESLELKNDSGKVLWSQDAYAFLEDTDAPDTVNPSLWRNTQNNHQYGLFEVMDGIYQVRGYDMSNITFIKGETGWIVFDPLMSTECAAAAKQLVDATLGEYPVKAVVISHSHVDHFGGIGGIITEDMVNKGEVSVIAPQNFETHVMSENVYAGGAMGRRANYQYGTLLTPGEKGSMSIGIGIGQSKGNISYITPTDDIKETGETRTIDGVTMEFQMTPGTEAPVEMNIYFPDKKALWLAENCTGTLHNLYTLRGAQVRDGNAWAYYIMQALNLYGDQAEVTFQAHNWPHWGNEELKTYMVNTAAVYKFINDQTLLYINQGYTENEIANMIKLPEDLEKVWYTRQYYGTVAHDAKAVYQKYMGWYDANPIHLNALEPTEYSKKLVEYLGDTEKVLEMAKKDYDNGEYQWVAEITNALVFDDPTNQEARYLCADALEQLGYQAESGTWRNAYLSAALELREGSHESEAAKAGGSKDTQKHMAVPQMLDYMGIRFDSNKAQDMNFDVNLIITDLNTKYHLVMRSGVLLYQENALSDHPDATWSTPRLGLFAIIQNNKEGMEKYIQVEGNKEILGKFADNLEKIPAYFNIIEP